MHWLTVAGLCLVVAGVLLSCRQYLLSARSLRKSGDRAPDRYIDGVRHDLYQGAVWLGVALILVSQIAQQLERGAPVQEMALSLAAGAGMVFICGLYAGRLMLRRQLRLESATEPRV